MSTAVASYENYDDDAMDDHPQHGLPSSAKGGKQAVDNMDDEAEGEEEGDDDEDDEEDDEEDEDDDEDEDEDESERPKKKAKGRKKRNMLSRFVDVEAEVDDDDEDVDDDEEEYAKEGRDFIAAEDDTVDDNVVMRAADHHRFREDRSDIADAHQIARDLRDRYRKTAARYTGDSSDVPQRLLMPGVSDASLWQVRVRPGKERELIISLMRKSIDLQYSSRPLEIGSAFWRDSLPGMIYVEARSQAQVNYAISGLVGVFLSRGVVLVPIDEMASLLRIKKNMVTLTPGSWVRIKRGKYAGDLAQVIDVTDNGEEAGLRFIPRIDLTPREDFGDSKKRKKSSSSAPLAFRPPQKFFIAEEVSKVYKNKVNLKPGHSRKFVFQGDTYNNGYIEKDIKISGLIIDNVNPTLDEITRFTQGDRDAEGGGGENAVDLSIIAEAARKAATVVLQPGDHVEVFEGEQTGMHGIVESIQGEVITLRARHVDIEGQKIEVPAASVRKKFKAGDHVKVMAGKNADETGLVVSILNDTITFLSDMSLQEVTVFAKDVREAAEVGAGTNAIGNYELHDLVQLDQQTIGVIYKTERDSFRVIDQNGQTRLVQPHQITMRKDSRRAIATDAQGHEIRISDNMKEIDGEQRKGQVLHIYQSHHAFLYNREITENGGVFVTRARGLQSVAPKGALARPGVPDLSKMNPAAMSGGMVGSGMMGKGHRDKLMGINIVVVKGPFKGYLGTIKDTNGAFARVELHTQNKVITIEKEKLRRKHPHTGAIEALESGSFNMPPPKSTSGSATPSAWGNSAASSGSRTPFGRTSNPYASQTPAWSGAGSQTPHHSSSDGFGGRTPAAGFGDGGRTPASGGWGASSRTPNPYPASSKTPNPYAANDGGRTPAHTSGGTDGKTPTWGAPPPGPGSRTPALGGGLGGRTPAGAGRGGFGGATPNPYAVRSANVGGRSGATPSGAGASSGGWGINDDNIGGWGAVSAPTPGPLSAPTPGMFSSDDWSTNATTPYAGAPTPYVGAPTPGAGHNYAQTPGMYAQTPGMHYAQTPGISAATPGAALSAPTPGAHHSSFADSSSSHAPEAEGPWILGCSNVWVTIVARDDLEESHFAGGVYDGRNVVVVNVMDMSSSGNYHASTATVRFIDQAEKGTSRSIPIDYLDPVLPKVAKEKVMVFKGPFRHQVFEIQSISTEGIWASPLDGGDPVILDLHNVVKWQDWSSAIL